MRLQDTSKRVSRKWKKWNPTVWEKSYKSQVPHRVQLHANVFNHSNTLFLFRYQNRVLLIMFSFIHLISIMQIKTLATSGVHLDISISQPLWENLLHCMTWQVMFYYFSNRFYKNHPMVQRCSGSLSTVASMGHRNQSEQAAKQADCFWLFFPEYKDEKKFQLLRFYWEDKTKKF